MVNKEVLLGNVRILRASVTASPLSVVVEERSRKDDQKTTHEEDSKEEVNEREAEINSESQMTSHEEVLLPDSITPSIKLFLFNIILPTIDIFDTALVKKLFPNGFFGVSSPTTRLWSSTSLHARNGACFDIKLIG